MHDFERRVAQISGAPCDKRTMATQSVCLETKQAASLSLTKQNESINFFVLGFDIGLKMRFVVLPIVVKAILVADKARTTQRNFVNVIDIVRCRRFSERIFRKAFLAT